MSTQENGPAPDEPTAEGTYDLEFDFSRTPGTGATPHRVAVELLSGSRIVKDWDFYPGQPLR